jgi:hypothetical protein
LSFPGKVFARVLLNRIRPLLLSQQRKEQSGFTPGRSTVDRILTMSVLLQTRREFSRPLWIAYVDLKAAFDSINRDALWLLFRGLGFPGQLVDLSCVRSQGQCSQWFEIHSGVRQGCILVPDEFLAPMDWILEHTVHKGMLGATINGELFTDLDYADDVALLAEMQQILLLSLATFCEEAKPFGLEINWDKTKIQVIAPDNPPPDTVSILNNNVEVVESFVYLGSQIHNTGSSEAEISR